MVVVVVKEGGVVLYASNSCAHGDVYEVSGVCGRGNEGVVKQVKVACSATWYSSRGCGGLSRFEARDMPVLT